MNPLSIACSIVPEAKGGPFVLWDPLPVACQKAKALGYDAIELFAPASMAFSVRSKLQGCRCFRVTGSQILRQLRHGFSTGE